MSEYQYYEFQAIDRPLGEADREALRELSTRARITATSFTNHYEWGDFKGDPARLMEQWFDLHLYLANWGTRRLIMRLPRRLVERARLDTFLLDVDWVAVWENGENLIVDMCRDEVEQDYGDWDDSSGWLGVLSPLRADVLSGDLRLFYLCWLTTLEDDALEADTCEPLAGIGPLTGALEAAADFFGIDRDLLHATAEHTDDLDSAVPGGVTWAAVTERRTVGALMTRVGEIRRQRACAETERRAEERRHQQVLAERMRRKRLEDVMRRGEAVWAEVETEIARRNAAGYDRAAALLTDLEAIAIEDGMEADFIQRLDAIRDHHARKERFLERLKGLGKR